MFTVHIRTTLDAMICYVYLEKKNRNFMKKQRVRDEVHIMEKKTNRNASSFRLSFI